MKTALLTVFVGLAILNGRVSAQLLTPWDKAVENFHYRLKNIEFFIDRFNNQLEGSGRVAALSADSVAVAQFIQERDRKILSLFDLSVVKRQDTAWIRLANSFVLSVNRQKEPIFLHFSDAGWFASADFMGKEHERDCGFRAQLEVGTQRDGETFWKLARVSNRPGDDEDVRTCALHFAPNSNGTNFSQVVERLMDSKWLSSHSGSDSRFISWMMSKECVLEGAVHINYHFLQIPGWYVQVSYLDRESNNSGWLIKKIARMSDQEKLTAANSLWKYP